MRRSRLLGLASLATLALLLALAACSSPSQPAAGDAATLGDGRPSEDAATDDAPPASTCPAPSGPPTTHSGDVAKDETWAAGEHLVTSSVTVRAGATLTLAPCAVVKLGPDRNLTVDRSAKGLVAAGEATQPVSFERAETAQAWGAIVAFAPATLRLTHTLLRGGGTTAKGDVLAVADLAGASLAVRNQTEKPVDALFVDHVTVEGSTGLGVMLDSAGFIEGSTNLVVRGSGSFPVYLGAANATRLPRGVYAPNGKQAFLLQSVGVGVYDNGDPILGDATLPERGLPYVVGANGGAVISVGDGRSDSPKGVLTIEPGVELRFRAAAQPGQLLVRGQLVGGAWQPQGTLVAKGTAAKPIVFTSQAASPAPGDWQGLYFERAVDPRTTVQFARVAYAGADSTITGLCKARMGATNYDADCSAILLLEGPPPAAFITDTLFERGLGCGVYRGWKGAQVDFAATNTFTGLAGCAQSNVAPVMGDCDATGPCR